ncbi:MAG: glycerophosphodiester phosphodiesterase family protein, partial [Gammaproteobacteria bacterium]|nr:glycerophosphodiester phosphodiesterase family protein [Gammaproteobacteria bacterium]
MGLADLPLVIGHRGASGLAPENTLESFRLAYELGVSGVELDVHFVADHLIVIHDDTLERTTDGRGKIARLDLAALRKLDAGGGSPIPLLEEVLAELPRGVGVNIELKGPETAEPTARLLNSYPEADLLVSSFEHRELARFHHLNPEVRVAPLFHRWRRDAWRTVRELDAWSINLSLKIVNRGIIEEAEKRGTKTLIYTVNDLPEARRVLNQGATGVFTDYPDVVTRAAL